MENGSSQAGRCSDKEDPDLKIQDETAGDIQGYQNVSDKDVTVTIRPDKIPKIKIERDRGERINAGKESSNHDRVSKEEDKYRRRTLNLRRMLKLYFYSAVKYNNHLCSFHLVYFVFMVLQIAKLSCITAQMFNFGDERGKFNNVVKRGHVTLKNLLLKGWDASWETPPYPPAHGDFAVYDIKSLKEKINYAVERLYNAEEDAIGFYKRPQFDSVTAEMTYFDFGGFEDGDTFHGISIKTKAFKVHVNNHTNQSTKEISYSYDVDKDFLLNNLTEPIKRMLTFTLLFKIESVRVYIDKNKARCLLVDGKIKFEDPDNNGQVTVDLDTTTERQICLEFGYDVPDVTIEAVSKSLIIGVLFLAFVSLAYTIICMAFGIFVYRQTKRYMKKYYVRYFEPERYKETRQQTEVQGTSQDSLTGGNKYTKDDLPWKEYGRFIKGWDLLVLAADLTTIIGNLGLQLQIDEQWTVTSLDTFTVLLGIGCLFAWIGLLRYFKFNYKFHLLFNTMYASIGDVLAYLACICVLFIAYMSFGYVVLGPYHIKFATASSTAETLFSIVNGDEIYATFAMLETDQTGGDLVPVVYKIYLGSFIAIFTIIVLNLLIALFTNAYDAIKRQYEEPEDQEEGPIEAALKQLLVSEDNKDRLVTDSVLQLYQSDRHRLSANEDNLRKQLQRIVSISKTKHNFILKRPRTIKTFIQGNTDETLDAGAERKRNNKCCCALYCLFGFCAEEEKEFCLKRDSR